MQLLVGTFVHLLLAAKACVIRGNGPGLDDVVNYQQGDPPAADPAGDQQPTVDKWHESSPDRVCAFRRTESASFLETEST